MSCLSPSDPNLGATHSVYFCMECSINDLIFYHGQNFAETQLNHLIPFNITSPFYGLGYAFMNLIGGLMWQLLHEHETLPICNGQWSHNFTSNSTVLSAKLCANYQSHMGLILPACGSCYIGPYPKGASIRILVTLFSISY